MLTVATLLRSGGDFTVRHVARLRDQIAKVLPDARFVCLSDVAVPCDRIPLIHDNWVRWWGQLELFRPNLFTGPVLYMDLDTTVLRDPGIPVAENEFWSLEGPIRPFPTSGIMSWWGDYSRIYLANKETTFRRQKWVNDGIFPHVTPKIIQQHVPGFYSYKVHIKHRKALPEDTRVVYFHGYPRPWDLEKEVTL